MLRQLFPSEHILKTQSGFFDKKGWIENLIPRYSIKKLVSISIVVVLSFFLIIIAITLTENIWISRYQQETLGRVFPLLMVSRDLQENLLELVNIEDSIERIDGTDSTTMVRQLDVALSSTKENLNDLQQLVNRDTELKAIHQGLSASFNDIEHTLKTLSSIKSTLLDVDKKYHGFQTRATQLFEQMTLLEDELSGKVSLMSARFHKRMQKRKDIPANSAETQKKIDMVSTQIGLTLSRLGKLLTKLGAVRSPEELMNLRDNELKQNIRRLENEVREFHRLTMPGRNQTRLDEISVELISQIGMLHDLLLTANDSLLIFGKQRLERLAEIQQLSARFRQFSAQMSRGLESVAKVSEIRAKETVDSMQWVTSVGGWVIFLSGSILALTLSVFLTGIMRRINQPINTLNQAMHRLSGGDYSTRLSSYSAVSAEFAQLWHDFNHFAERTERLVGEQIMIIDNAEIGIAWVRGRQFLKVNSKMLEIFCATEEEMVGKNTADIYANKEDYLEVGEHYQILDEGGIFTGEYELKRADGRSFWCRLSGKSTGVHGSEDSVWLYEDITDRKLSEDKLYHLANFDSLTGLPNRSYFRLMLDQMIQRAHRNQSEFAILFIDLDHFKHINDSQGHEAGDKVLCQIASRIKNAIRESDIAARLGGDEFTVIVDGFHSREDLFKVASKLNFELRKSVTLGNRELFVGGSIGISLFPEDASNAKELLSHADAAMYMAKKHGRNNAQFYHKKIAKQSETFLELSGQLRTAIENEEFELYFQPKVELKTRNIIGMEALIRWNKPGLGQVSPVDFIPVLEESGLISEVGGWVIQEAGRTYKRWLDQGLQPGHIAVNLSERQFHNDQLLHSLDSVIEQTGIPASALELEITESLMMGDTDKATIVLQGIKDRGFNIAMDDFGTGYSSLAYLKRFPIDTIKIDRSFVRDIVIDEDDSAIIDAIFAIAKQLRLKSVAEGVETQEQLDLLLSKGCEIGQGYLFSKPVSEAEMGALLSPA